MSKWGRARQIHRRLVTTLSLAGALILLLGGCSLHGGTHATSSPAATETNATSAVSTPTGTAIAVANPTTRPTPSSTLTPTATGSPNAELPTEPTPLVLKAAPTAVTVLAWAPGGSLLAASGGNPGDFSRDFAIRLWGPTGTLLATLNGHTEIVTSLAWSPDGQTLASGSADGTVRLWSRDGTFKTMLTGSDQSMGAVLSLAWSPDGSTLAVGYIGNPNGLKGYVGLYQADGRFIRTLPQPVDTGGKFLNLGWSPDGNMLAVGAVGYKIWRPDGTLVGSVYVGGTPQWGFAWAPDGKSFAIGDENGYVGRFTPDGTGIGTWTQNGSVESLAFSPDGSRIALRSHSYLVRLLPIDEQTEPLGTNQLAGPPQYLSNLVWSASPDLVASAAADGTVYVFDTAGHQVAALKGCDGPIESLAWSSVGLAAGSATGNVCLWPVRMVPQA